MTDEAQRLITQSEALEKEAASARDLQRALRVLIKESEDQAYALRVRAQKLTEEEIKDQVKAGVVSVSDLMSRYGVPKTRVKTLITQVNRELKAHKAEAEQRAAERREQELRAEREAAEKAEAEALARQRAYTCELEPLAYLARAHMTRRIQITNYLSECCDSILKATGERND